jgi:acyl-CoA synthetase (AMP-forming)/AMP-acid ligase II
VERGVSTGTRIEADPLTLSAGMSHRAITERILGLADEAGYRAAFIDAPEGTVTAWPRFARTVREAADGLRRRGLADGDSVGVLVQDAASFAIAVNAIRAAGAIAAPIRPDASTAEVAEQLNACGARLLITAAPLAELAAEAADRSRVRQLFAFGEAPGTTPFNSLLDGAKHGADMRGADMRGADMRGADMRGADMRGADMQHQADAHRIDAQHEVGARRTGGATEKAGLTCMDGWTGLSHLDVVVAGPPCGDGQVYTSLLDLTLLTGATIVAAPIPLITAAMRTYKGTAAIVPRGIDVPGIPPDRVFAVS